MTDTLPDSGWRFDKDYGNFDQVAPFLPEFMAVLAELEAADKYRYNDSFKGRIADIAGPHEDSAIYLLQGLERKTAEDAKVTALLAEGYTHVDELPARSAQRYRHIVLYPSRRMGGSWAEYHDARLIERDGKPHGILPKGKRTRGYAVGDRHVLVSP